MLTMLKTLEGFLYWNYSLKDSTLEQELANCYAVFDITTNNKSLYFDLKKSRKHYEQVNLHSDSFAKGNYIINHVDYFKFTKKSYIISLVLDFECIENIIVKGLRAHENGQTLGLSFLPLKNFKAVF